MPGRRHLEAFRQDAHYALRAMLRAPVFTAVVVLSLALGIGANSAVFSVINALMLRNLPVQNPEQLVELQSQYPGEPAMNFFGWQVYEHYRARTETLSDIFGISHPRFQVAASGLDLEPVDGEYVVGTYFSALGIQPALGRLIGPDDDRAGAGEPAVAVISWSYWRNHFNLDPSILGTRIGLDGVPATVIGVAPRGFAGLNVGRTAHLWAPAAMELLVQPKGRGAGSRMGLQLMGRLKPDVSIDEARAELRVLDQFRVDDLAAKSKDPLWRQATLHVRPASSGFAVLRDHFGGRLLVLMGIVALVLLIASTNIASLLAARAAARQREVAVRIALGASRLRLVRQLLAESVFFAIPGAALGLVLAYVGAQALVRSWPIDPRSGLQQYDIPLYPDAQVLLFTAGIALVAAVLCSLAPAWDAFASAAVSSLRAAPATETRARRRFGQGFVVAQVALSVVLLSAAVLFVGHMSDLRNGDLGFQRGSVLLVTLNPSGSGRSPEQLFQDYQGLLARLQRIPGVRSASLAALTPIQGGAASRFLRVEGFEERADARRRASLNWVGSQYFETIGTRVLAGRAFGPQDDGGPPVAMVNQRLARYYFGEGSAIGRRFAFEGEGRTYEIVGIVEDAKYSSLREPAPRTVYLNAHQDALGRVSQFALRTVVPPASISADVRRAVREELQGVAVERVRTLSEQVDASILPERQMARLSGALGAAGALLAAMGLYGLLAYTVARRTGEIGIRMALGATDATIVWMVLKRALVLVSIGLALGVPLAWWAQRLGAALVQDLRAGVILPMACAGAGMLLVAVLAAWLPARRAAGVHPVDALRQL